METAGVRCIVTGTTCTENQWRCEDSGACIDMGFLCDRVPDCDDYSDENRTLCDVRLGLEFVQLLFIFQTVNAGYY